MSIAVLTCYILLNLDAFKNPQQGYGWVILTVGLLLATIILVLNRIRYVEIDGNDGTMVVYSLLMPFGRDVDFSTFSGKFVTSGVFRGLGRIKMVHLVDGRRIRRVIYSIDYDNLDEIYKAIPLPEVKMKLTLGQELLLDLFDRAAAKG